MVVDDDLVFQRALSMKLRASGYDVMTAEDGSAAVSAVHKAKPDLILLDINFPPDVAHGGGLAWDGFLILNWLRRTEAIGVPVIAVTGGDVNRYQDKCTEEGILDLLPKPIDPDLLLAKIKAVLNEPAPEREERSIPSFSSPKRILFVDDESGWRQMAIQNLTDQGYEVVPTDDAEGAVSEAARIRPNLIVVDLKLEKASGLRIMRLLAVAHPGVPILVYVGLGLDPQARNEVISQGARRCLHKRSMEELLTAVEQALQEPVEVIEPEDDSDRSSSRQAEVGLRTLLVVEDDPDFSEQLRTFLESNGFYVSCVPNAAEGLRQLAATNFDLVLCDMVLQGPSGEDFYREVERVQPELCRRFVFMTGHDAHPRTDRFIRQVRALMLWKPFLLSDVLVAIEAVQRRDRLPSPLERRQPLVSR